VKISFQMAMWMCVVFATVALGVAINGFLSLSTIADPVQREEGVGYAWFWAFLGSLAVVFGVLSWMITRGKFGELD
jgi:hypothetical protein